MRKELLEKKAQEKNQLVERLMEYWRNNPCTLGKFSSLIGIHENYLGKVLNIHSVNTRSFQAKTQMKIEKFLIDWKKSINE